MVNRVWRAAGALGVAVLMSSCGGGGGDSDNGSNDGSNITVTPSTLTLDLIRGTPHDFTVSARVTNTSVYNGVVHAVIAADPQHLLMGGVSIWSTGPSTYAVSATLAPNLTQDLYQGSFEVQLCRDLACTSPYPNSRVSLPYRIAFRTLPLEASPDTVTYSYVQGATPAPTTVSLSSGNPPLQHGNVYVVVASDANITSTTPTLPYMGGPPYWFSVTPQPGLAVGQHSGSLEVRLCNDPACTTPILGMTTQLGYSITVTP
jgi:hypothetical protein